MEELTGDTFITKIIRLHVKRNETYLHIIFADVPIQQRYLNNSDYVKENDIR